MATEEIHDSFIFLLAAAHDTLASAFTSLVYYLAAHPEWQDNLRAELTAGQLNAPVDAPLAALPLQDMCLWEALRLNAPAPVIWRRATQPFSIYGYDVPAGTITGVSPLLVHLDPAIWKNPTAFDPLRFTPEEEAKRSRFAFVPFGGGVHKCLGLHFAQQQARIFLRTWFRSSTYRDRSTSRPLVSLAELPAAWPPAGHRQRKISAKLS